MTAPIDYDALLELLDHPDMDANDFADDAAAAIRALRAAAVESERDAAMLDWLDAQRQDMVERDQHGDPELVGHAWGVYGQCNTAREAIAADMAAQEKANG